MAFPHTEMDLNRRLSEALESQRRSFLEYLAQKPSEVLKGQGKPKESPGNTNEEVEVDEQVAGHWVPAKRGNPGSFLLKPSDRDKFTNWGKKKAKKKVQEGLTTLRQELEVLRPSMAEAAQTVYDAWDPEDEWGEYGGGGPCDDIASAISAVIAGSIDTHIDEGGHEGDDHAFLLVSRAGERYWVDLAPSVYESGGGYSWRKIPDVRIRPEDIIIEAI